MHCEQINVLLKAFCELCFHFFKNNREESGRNFIEEFKKSFPCLLSMGEIFAPQAINDNQVD